MMSTVRQVRAENVKYEPRMQSMLSTDRKRQIQFTDAANVSDARYNTKTPACGQPETRREMITITTTSD